MRTSIASSAFVTACALTMWSCSGGSIMPSSPSVLSPAATPSVSGGTFRPLEDPPAMPAPETPAPDPGAPVPDPSAPTTPAPGPLDVVISIIGSLGSGAFMPNPTMANVGDQIIFTNNDTRLHHIVMDDGTDLGDVAPGQSSAPMPLVTPAAAGFHCTLHPTMVGGINGEILPPYVPPPPDDYYAY